MFQKHFWMVARKNFRIVGLVSIMLLLGLTNLNQASGQGAAAPGDIGADLTTLSRGIGIMVDNQVYLPLVQKAPTGITGKVTKNGLPLEGIELSLEIFTGMSWSGIAHTETDGLGNYEFPHAASLAPGQMYCVTYYNFSDGDSLLTFWVTRHITSYTAGSQVVAGNFDLANIHLVSPASGSTVSLPTTLTWEKRIASPSDSYELNMYVPNGAWFSPALLGYTNEYTLNSLPNNFQYGVWYRWFMMVYNPDGAHGQSYYYYTINFSGGAGQPVPSADRTNFQQLLPGHAVERFDEK